MSQGKRKGKRKSRSKSGPGRSGAKPAKPATPAKPAKPAETTAVGVPAAAGEPPPEDQGGARGREQDIAARAAARRRRRDAPVDADLPIAQERSRGRIAGTIGLLGIVATFVAIALTTKASGDGPQPVTFGGDVGNNADRAERLLDYATHDADQAAAAALHAAALLSGIAIGLYLCWAIRTRNPKLPWYMGVLSVVAPVLLATAAVVGYLALSGAAETFQALDSGRSVARAKQITEDSGTYQLASVLDVVGRLVFAVWVGLLSREAMKVGLLSVFLGIWGVGAAIALAVGIFGLTIGEALYVGWIASVAIIALGYWPGGRPEGWTHRMTPAEAT